MAARSEWVSWVRYYNNDVWQEIVETPAGLRQLQYLFWSKEVSDEAQR